MPRDSGRTAARLEVQSYLPGRRRLTRACRVCRSVGWLCNATGPDLAARPGNPFSGPRCSYTGVESSRDREFAEFVERRHRVLLSSFVLVGDVQRAEDLVQTALCRTFTSWSRLRSVDAAESYVRTIMVRLALRWQARRWSREISSGTVPELLRASHDDHVAVGVDVWRALVGLAIEQRAVLVLGFVEDFSEADTAAVLHCSIGTVKNRTSRALAALRSSGLLVDDEPGVAP